MIMRDIGFFLLLSSYYGQAYFSKWFVIASTMNHLRKDFYEDFAIPTLTNDIITKYVTPLKEAFMIKEQAYNDIQYVKEKILEHVIEMKN